MTVRDATVGELIEQLKKLNQKATVGVRAGCCSHTHPIQCVRERDDGDWDDDVAAVIIDARE